ncbi:MAG: hypothetical protein GY816_01585 [Cytophagales bacterium]|nr:hypothetical protein [Cytophagales bacterium]
MQNLYSENKAKFYRLYFKRIPIDQHFNDLKFHLPHLPLSKNRDPIFDELISLFKGRRWISFYALALPQVEGLFSEMCQAVSPENDFSQKSLTQKVKTVRPFHDLSISYFDYYEYFIPFQRNKFSHTGYDEDFKLKSYDLLLDLTHLLKIFFELDNPLVKIKKLHVRRNYEDFISLPEFVDYFGLIEKLKTVQKKSVKADIETFERTFLVTDCGIQYTCYEMIQGTPILLKTLIFEIELILSEFDEVKLKELNKIKIQQLMERTEILGAVKNYFISHDKEEETLVTYHNFIKYFKRHLPSLDAEIKTELEKIKSEYGELLNNLSLMTELCKN